MCVLCFLLRLFSVCVQQFPVCLWASGLWVTLFRDQCVCGWYSEHVCICGVCLPHACCPLAVCVHVHLWDSHSLASVGSVSRWVCILSPHVG